MLDLTRASAGSGKTYELAKYYIRFLIAQKQNDGSYRLRSGETEIRDALPSILAITFTNKATNEMQMRIVDKLDALWRYRPGAGLRTPDYLDDFISELGASAQEIGNIAGIALRELLIGYSNFNVSTIDSFFQKVLRTLAYETGVSQGYSVEMESDYVSRVGMDTLFSDIDRRINSPVVKRAAEWLSLIIDNDRSSRWNIYQKKMKSAQAHTMSEYESLLMSFKNIENEDFREYRDIVKQWLSNNNLLQNYNSLEAGLTERAHNAFDKLQECADTLATLCRSAGLDQTGKSTKNKPFNSVLKVRKYKWAEIPKDADWLKPIANPAPGGAVAKALAGIADWDTVKDYHNEDLLSAFEDWLRELVSENLRLWLALRDGFPFLGLLNAVLEKREEYLSENSSVELGETAFLLSKFIVDGVAPFFYERMGARIEHFLADEFQDTSRMQWVNLKPLFAESVANGNDNLIIGDAKQSIYRFRNADPRLIARDVPEDPDFRDRINIRPAGTALPRSTNYRSDLRVVQWNNAFFSYMRDTLAGIASPRPAGESTKEIMESYYADVAQNAKSDGGGYVEVSILKGKTTDASGFDEKYKRMTDVIEDARSRNYKFRDIAILCRSNSAADTAVEYIRNYNKNLNPGDADKEPIRFVSEQSLIIAWSMAVQQVETVLHSLAAAEAYSPASSPKYGPGNINELKSRILMYRRQNPDKSASECLEDFPTVNFDSTPLQEMLAGMPSTALPALVEAVIGNFIDRDLADEDAAYLAAFQDVVLEYCESHSSDLPSFLEWWSRVRSKRSISSPENVDAVQILTIHKSKGLEFPIVVVLEAVKESVRFGDYTGGRNWKWVSAENIRFGEERYNELIPPVVPVRITEALDGTCLAPLLQNQYNEETLDSMNAVYVAFTRAVNELYIFVKQDKGSASANAYSLSALLQNFADPETPERRTALDTTFSVLDTEADVTVSYGNKIVKEEKESREKTTAAVAEEEACCAVNEPTAVKEKSLGSYQVTAVPSWVRFHPESEINVSVEEDDPDARETGILCHAVMERVVTSEDVEREIRRARTLGLAGVSEVQNRLLDTLPGHVAWVATLHPDWFGPEAKKAVIYSERSLLMADNPLKRPDRVMVWPDGMVDVIDYKFGKYDSESHSRYVRQVKGYVSLLRKTGRFKAVRGWLWYIFEDKVQMV